MKTGIYIHSGSGTGFVGVQKKINDQIGVLSQYYDVYEVVTEKEKTNPIRSILWRMPGGSWGADYDGCLRRIDSIKKEKDEIAFFYIRVRPLDRRYMCFLSSLRIKFPNAKIILEYPQYPYVREYLHSKTMWPWAFKDVCYRYRIKKVADIIVTYSDDDFILGVPTIRTMNGIIVQRIDYTQNGDDDCINLIAVASMQRHHGYERVIKGIKTYISNGGERDVKLHLVGQGPQVKYYSDLADELGISNRVILWGNKQGEDLEKLYKMADIGIGSLGFHLIGEQNTISSTLKTREYLAHGLPFVSACNEDVFMKNPDTGFFMKYPDDETEIPIDDVVRFYDGLLVKYNRNRNRVREAINVFAKNTVDMSVVMKPVINYIESEGRTISK